jgi:CspA family cold shock protein
VVGLEKVIRIACLGSKAMAKGKVDFFNDTGGYGFISTEDADEDVFFHMEDVGGPDLEEGQEIEFDIEDAPKGPRAKNVTRL